MSAPPRSSENVPLHSYVIEDPIAFHSASVSSISKKVDWRDNGA